MEWWPPGAWTLGPIIAVLVLSVVVIGFAGYRLAVVADEIADRTGMGEALAGALLLGVTTSLPGIVATLTGALAGDAEFTIANPIGGVAVQTVWLAIADLLYRRANLEHAAASLENVMQTLVLVALLALPVIAYATPQLSVASMHPVTFAIPILYGYGVLLLRRLHQEPMWQPTQTSETAEDVPEPPSDSSMRQLWTRLGVLAAAVAFTGYALGEASLGLIRETGLPSGFVGFTITTGITSLPELVTLIAAVKIGALTLGIGDIIGGNTFDTLMISVADVAYRDGPIYQSAGPATLLMAGSTLLITGILAAGLIARQRRGIGFEGFAVPGVYVLTVVLLLWGVG